MFFLGAVIFASLATVLNVCIPVLFFCSQKMNEEEEIARFADSRVQYNAANEI